ncbi:hypothetical protein D3C76_439930 [compost metagenome]
MSRQRGFSLIEVLVSLLLTCIGVLGMAVLQGRAVQYSHDATLRNNAIILADDLLEMMRSNRTALLGAHDKLSSASAYYKAVGSSLPSTPGNCADRDRSSGGAAIATADLGCWRGEVEKLLPVTPAILDSNFFIIRDTDSTVRIQVAWADAKSGLCKSICTYTLRAEL